ncbi:protein of unknown function [Burkholderia multivorans]
MWILKIKSAKLRRVVWRVKMGDLRKSRQNIKMLEMCERF